VYIHTFFLAARIRLFKEGCSTVTAGTGSKESNEALPTDFVCARDTTFVLLFVRTGTGTGTGVFFSGILLVDTDFFWGTTGGSFSDFTRRPMVEMSYEVDKE